MGPNFSGVDSPCAQPHTITLFFLLHQLYVHFQHPYSISVVTETTGCDACTGSIHK